MVKIFHSSLIFNKKNTKKWCCADYSLCSDIQLNTQVRYIRLVAAWPVWLERMGYFFLNLLFILLIFSKLGYDMHWIFVTISVMLFIIKQNWLPFRWLSYPWSLTFIFIFFFFLLLPKKKKIINTSAFKKVIFLCFVFKPHISVLSWTQTRVGY